MPSTQVELSARLQFHLKVGGPHRSIDCFHDHDSPVCSHQTVISGRRVYGPLPRAMAVHESVLTVKVARVVQQLPDFQGVDLQGRDKPFSSLLGPQTLLGTHT